MMLFLTIALATLARTSARSVTVWDSLQLITRGRIAQNQGEKPDHEEDLMIIGAGFGRTGTTSFVAALQKLGLKPYHFVEGVMETPGHIKLWEDHATGSKQANVEAIVQSMRENGFNATADFPVSMLYNDLRVRYPGARVVLTVRGDGDGHRWAENALDTFLRFPSLAERIPFRWLPQFRSLAVIIRWVFHTALKTQWDDPKALARAYDNWILNVQSTVPHEQLLVFSPQDGWEPLCAFLAALGNEIIDQRCRQLLENRDAYPFENDKQRYQASLKRMDLVSTAFEYSPTIAITIVVICCFWRRNGLRGKTKKS